MKHGFSFYKGGKPLKQTNMQCLADINMQKQSYWFRLIFATTE